MADHSVDPNYVIESIELDPETLSITYIRPEDIHPAGVERRNIQWSTKDVDDEYVDVREAVEALLEAILTRKRLASSSR